MKDKDNDEMEFGVYYYSGNKTGKEREEMEAEIRELMELLDKIPGVHIVRATDINDQKRGE